MTTYSATFFHTGAKEGVTYNGENFFGVDAVGKLCRKLEEGTLHVFTPGGTLSIIADIARRKKLTLRDTDKTGLHYTKWEPYSTTRCQVK